MLNEISQSLSLSKILYGVSRSIDIIKRIAPIYNEIKPLVQKFPEFKEKITEYMNKTNHSKNLIKNVENDTHLIKTDNIFDTKGPTFFQ